MILEGEDGRTRELPFLAVALALHAAALTLAGPQGPRTMRAHDAVAVDFVAQVPKAPAPPTPELAPVAAAPKPEPKAEPAPTPRPAPHRRARKRLSPEQVAARKAAREAARAARLERQRLAAEQRAAAKAEAERVRLAKLEAQRVAREARIAAQKAAAEKAARQRAELNSALASMKDPDEKLADAVADPDTLASGNVAPGAGAGVAAFAPSNSDSVYDVQRDGVDPAKQSGGGSGTAWSIAGPAGNRRIIHQRLPRAPQWMSERGLELAVTIRFEVLPDGTVRRSAVVRKTSGFPEVDRAALDAIRSWRFERLAPGADAGSVWGDVTLRFLLG